MFYKTSLWGFKGEHKIPYIKLTITDLKVYPKVRNAVERGEIRFKDMWKGDTILTYESNIAYTLRFMIDHAITGINWLELPQGKWQMRSDQDKVSNCQIEFDCQ